MEIKRLFDILKRKKIGIVMILIIFILLGYLYSFYYVVPKYKSTSTLLLIPNSATESREITNSDLTLNSGLISTYSNIATNSTVLRQTINNLELDMTEQELLNQMEVKIINNTYIIQIAVSNTDPQKAMEITKELTNVFLEKIQEIYNLNNVGIVDEAQLPEYPYNVNHIRDIVIFFAIGILVSIMYTGLIYIFDNTIKKEEDIEKYLQLIPLGNIPLHKDKKQEIVNRDMAKSYITECINTIRTNILYMNAAKNAKTILITSCTPKEGKSWFSANIATAFAETNQKVLLVDADMRKGRAHRIFKVNNNEGLSNYLQAITEDREENIKLGKNYIKETQIPNLHIITNGTIPPNPSELIDSNNMKELIACLKNIYDIIIVDAPPCKLVTDSIILSTMVDSTVLVANSEKTKIRDLNEVKKAIQVVGGEITGAILNKTKVTGKTYRESYYYEDNKQKYIEEIEEIEQDNHVDVSELIEKAIPKLKEEQFDIILEEDLIEEKSEEKIEEQNNKNYYIEEFAKKQNELIEKMLETVSDMKVQLNSETIQNKMKYKEDKEAMEEFIELKLEELRQKSSAEWKEEISKLENREKERLTKEQVEDIVKQEKLTREEIEDIVEQGRLTREEIEDIVEQGRLTREEIEDIVEQGRLTREEIEDIVEQGKLTRKEIENIVKQQVEKIDYTEQIVKINEMLINLKDSYLELSNKIGNNQIEKDNIDNKNVIDMKTFKKGQNKTRIYSIDEDISYEELEETASCIIPIKSNASNYSIKNYSSI